MEDNKITISIGGISLGFRFRNRKLTNRLMSRYAGYCQENKTCDCEFQCSFSKNKLASYQQVKYSSGADGSHHARRYDFSVRWQNGRGEMALWPSLYSFDACLRVVLANFITERNGLLLHASAVVRNGSGFVFIGPSGSGKTTIARLSAAKRILSDEIVALRTGPKTDVRIYGTPFWGEMGKGPYCPRSYPVRSIFILKKSGTLHTLRIGRDIAVRALLRCVCLFGKEPKDLQTALDTCSKVVATVDCKELCFPKKPLEWGKLGI
jgi:hypothetical protein